MLNKLYSPSHVLRHGSFGRSKSSYDAQATTFGPYRITKKTTRVQWSQADLEYENKSHIFIFLTSGMCNTVLVIPDTPFFNKKINQIYLIFRCWLCDYDHYYIVKPCFDI